MRNAIIVLLLLCGTVYAVDYIGVIRQNTLDLKYSYYLLSTTGHDFVVKDATSEQLAKRYCVVKIKKDKKVELREFTDDLKVASKLYDKLITGKQVDLAEASRETEPVKIKINKDSSFSEAWKEWSEGGFISFGGETWK